MRRNEAIKKMKFSVQTFLFSIKLFTTIAFFFLSLSVFKKPTNMNKYFKTTKSLRKPVVITLKTMKTITITSKNQKIH